MSPAYSKYSQEHILPLMANKDYFNIEPKPELLATIDEGRRRLPFSKHIDYHMYLPKRGHRYRIVKQHFPDAFEGTVLDVGDREGAAQPFMIGTLTTLDKNNPELASFDWDKNPLPFKDAFFTNVLCLDTLEHINDIHTAFADLLRVSQKTVVVSLPNSWKKVPKELVKGRGFRASYGLPIEKPMDRHRWHINTEDIEDFFFYNAAKNGWRVDDICYYMPITTWWHKLLPLVRPIIPERYYKNLFVMTVFAHFSRVSQ